MSGNSRTPVCSSISCGYGGSFIRGNLHSILASQDRSCLDDLCVRGFVIKRDFPFRLDCWRVPYSCCWDGDGFCQGAEGNKPGRYLMLARIGCSCYCQKRIGKGESLSGSKQGNCCLGVEITINHRPEKGYKMLSYQDKKKDTCNDV